MLQQELYRDILVAIVIGAIGYVVYVVVTNNRGNKTTTQAASSSSAAGGTTSAAVTNEPGSGGGGGGTVTNEPGSTGGAVTNEPGSTGGAVADEPVSTSDTNGSDEVETSTESIIVGVLIGTYILFDFLMFYNKGAKAWKLVVVLAVMAAGISSIVVGSRNDWNALFGLGIALVVMSILQLLSALYNRAKMKSRGEYIEMSLNDIESVKKHLTLLPIALEAQLKSINVELAADMKAFRENHINWETATEEEKDARRTAKAALVQKLKDVQANTNELKKQFRASVVNTDNHLRETKETLKKQLAKYKKKHYVDYVPKVDRK